MILSFIGNDRIFSPLAMVESSGLLAALSSSDSSSSALKDASASTYAVTFKAWFAADFARTQIGEGEDSPHGDPSALLFRNAEREFGLCVLLFWFICFALNFTT